MQEILHNSIVGADLLEIIAGNYSGINHKFFPLFEKHPEMKDAILTFSENNKNLSGTTCLHHAILYSNVGIVAYLLEQGVSANLVNHVGFKAIDFAHYQASTVFEGNDKRSNNMLNLLTTYAEKERLNQSLLEKKDQKSLKI